jgi:dihydrofolate reductase
VKFAIIAAMSRNRVIGKDGKLPWHIPEDLKRVKSITSGFALLMGRRTFESFGKPLPNRRNVVLTSRPIPNIETYVSLAEALQALKEEEKVFIFGGGELFGRFLEKVDEMYLTLVDQDVEGDTFFPPYEHLIDTRFLLVKREAHSGFTFLDYVRIN